MDVTNIGPTDPEVVAFVVRTAEHYVDLATDAPVAEVRAAYNALCESFHAGRPAGVRVVDAEILGTDGVRVPVRRYVPTPGQASGHRSSERDRTHVLYMHGGGFVVGGLESHDDVCAEFADATGCNLTSVDYRLAPEHLFPAAVDDAEAVYRALLADGVGRIIVAGDSAGANLAAGVSLRARRCELTMPIGQLLIYPFINARLEGGSYVENANAPILSTAASVGYFETYTGRTDWHVDPPEDLTPLSAEDFRGLPPTVLTSAGFDPLRDDAELYAGALARAGVPCVWRNEPELVHGYLRARHMSRVAARSFAFMIDALRAMAAG